jgi:hypothetical protein
MRAVALLCLVLLTGCGTTAESVWAPDSEVAARAYVHPGPASVTLYTVINNRSGEGGHTGLMINGSQRVLWDPAGSWYNPFAPERNDVHFGVTPRMEEIYIDYHARVTWRVVAQQIEISRETADRLIALALQEGPVSSAQCALSTSRILSQVPEFADAPRGWFPKGLMAYFDTLPGVTKSVVYDDDDDNNQPLLRQQISVGQDAI